ncbi:hypothetical protein [Alteromonas australica]|uniref:hypothetical protein n=1 Tax=Alteromonas australica TaxID=589873 RepID=UPI003F676915
MELTAFELAVVIFLSGIFLAVLYLIQVVNSSLQSQKQLVLNLSMGDDKRFAEIRDLLENDIDRLEQILDSVRQTEEHTKNIRHVSDLVQKYQLPSPDMQKQIDEMEVDNEHFSRVLK